MARNLISVPTSATGYNTLCRCNCKGKEDNHVCFEYGCPRLRGFCPPCFEAKVVEPARTEAVTLHNAYHQEMTRINGFRIRNERSYAEAAKDAIIRATPEVGGYPYRNRSATTRSREEDLR